MNPFKSPAERKKLLWPLALAATIVCCSSHELPVWAHARMGEDKLEHFFVFGLIATLVGRLGMIQRTRPLGIYAAALIASVFGLTDELHQHFTPGREMDVLDWLADTGGAVLATVLYARWHGYRRLLETPVANWWRRRPVGGLIELPGLWRRAA